MLGDYAFLEWTALVGYELLLFAGFFFVLGSIDDFAVDLYYLRLRIAGRVRTPEIERAVAAQRPLAGSAAVMIPAWRESAVIGTTVSHALKVWPHAELQIYVGCYRNDPETVEAAMAGAAGDSRLRLVIHDCDGPSSKADCLNRIYAAIEEDEGRAGRRFRMIVLHDAEDMVDPAALSLVDAALDRADFVQIPVLPEPQRNSRWIAGHYCDEFAEAHGKALLVREALGAGLPAAGVGCAFARATLGEVASQAGHPRAPFASECLTEDYEFGLRMSQAGRGAAFLRLRGDDGRLVATRACFPPTVTDAVRQKTRWLHGIAFQGWERLGWQGRLSERWMRLRDRRAPLTAMVLAAAYALLVVCRSSVACGFFGLGGNPGT